MLYSGAELLWPKLQMRTNYNDRDAPAWKVHANMLVLQLLLLMLASPTFLRRAATTASLLYREPSSSMQHGGLSGSPERLHLVQRASFSSAGFTCIGLDITYVAFRASALSCLQGRPQGLLPEDRDCRFAPVEV